MTESRFPYVIGKLKAGKAVQLQFIYAITSDRLPWMELFRKVGEAHRLSKM